MAASRPKRPSFALKQLKFLCCLEDGRVHWMPRRWIALPPACSGENKQHHAQAKWHERHPQRREEISPRARLQHRKIWVRLIVEYGHGLPDWVFPDVTQGVIEYPPCELSDWSHTQELFTTVESFPVKLIIADELGINSWFH